MPEIGSAGFEARCPEAPDLAAYGETPAEAQQEIKIAVCTWLEILAEDGLPFPAAQACGWWVWCPALSRPTLTQEDALQPVFDGLQP